MERLKTRVVPPVGPLDAKLCFVGEAPGEEEDRLIEPFVGKAGILLNSVFRELKIIRNEVLITNVFNQRPPRNDVGYYYEDKSHTRLTWEGREHVERLEQWLCGLRDRSPKRPNLIVALGRTPMYHLTGKKRITKWRGSVLPCTLVEGFKVYPTYHPSYVQRLLNETRETLFGEAKKRQQNILPIFIIDLKRALIQSEFSEIRRAERRFDINSSPHEILAKLDQINAEATQVAVDIETLPGPNGPIVWCVGVSPSPDYALVIPFVKNGKLAWPAETEAQFVRKLSEIFLNPKIRKVFQNGGYDLTILGKYYGLRVADGTYDDTMWGSHATYPYLPKGLDFLTSVHTWEPYYKDEGKVHFGKRSSDTAEFEYNAKDCCVTREIIGPILEDAKECRTYSGYLRSMGVMPSLLFMMINGVRVDVEKKASLGRKFSALASEARERINSLAGLPYNPASPKDLQKLLYGQLGLEIQYHMKTKKATTDKNALEKLKRRYPDNEILSSILNFRKYDKLSSTYMDMPVDADGRVRTNYGFVSTWRLSSSESHFGSGGNLQNIPSTRTPEGRLIRSLFVPDEGLKMGRCDLSQAEARVVAWESGDLALMEAFLDPATDVHWENAKDTFHLPKNLSYEKGEKVMAPITGTIHTMKELRDLGKRIVHASNYGMGPFLLQASLNQEGFDLSPAQCKKLLLAYKGKRPLLGEWQRKIREEIKATRWLTTCLGRRRQFLGRMNDDTWKSAYAFRPQSTVGEVVCLGIQGVYEDVPQVTILLNVHDEVVFQYKEEEEEEALRGVVNAMEIPLEIGDHTLTIPAEMEIGWSWGETKEVEVKR